MAELERIANHFGDFGAICNDASFALMHAQCGMLRELTLRAAAANFGHRLMMDCVVPGGVSADLRPDGATQVRTLLAEIAAALSEAGGALRQHRVTAGSHRDTGASSPLWRANSARAAMSARVRPRLRCAPSHRLSALRRTQIRRAGPRRRRRQCARMDPHPRDRTKRRLDRANSSRAAGGRERGSELTEPTRRSEGLGFAEGFRGDISSGFGSTSGRIARCHLRDPSWFQWPLLEAAIEGNIVADFPLCNKSFNCSYSGHDL